MKPRIISLFCLISLSLSVTGCGAMLSAVVGKGFTATTRGTVKNMLELRNEESGKSVILVPMVHIGKESYYLEIADILDSLKREGYVTFCEGIIDSDYPVDTTTLLTTKDISENAIEYTSVTDSTQHDITRRKFRRIEKVPLSYQNLDIKAGKGKIFQSLQLLRATTDRDYWTDYTLKDFVDAYEARFGEIHLTEFDKTYPLDQPGYKKKCPDKVIRTWEGTQFSPRNIRLHNAIIGSDFDKIVVVYGAAHTRVMKHMLVTSTDGYVKVKKDFRR